MDGQRAARYREAVFQVFVLLRVAAQRRAQLPPEVVESCMARLVPLLAEEGALRLDLHAGSLLANGLRVPLRFGDLVPIESLVRDLAGRGLAGLEFVRGLEPGELGAAAHELAAGDECGAILAARLAARGVRNVRPLLADPRAPEASERETDMADQHLRAVFLAQRLLAEMRLQGRIDQGLAKVTLQEAVLCMLEEPVGLEVLALLQDEDASIFRHSIHVCVYAVLIGRGIGLPPRLLRELALGALFHDLGRVRGEADAPGPGLDHGERGVRRLVELGSLREPMLRAMLVCAEHHAPGSDERGRQGLHDRGLLASIVAVADRFDALASGADMQSTADVLAELRRIAREEHWPLGLVDALSAATAALPAPRGSHASLP
ncbi:MAG: HD domain-containing protein [Planctomycetes bacterium]|nr:HD domain-containing protein [Planctomycetota bacterium]